MADIRCPNCGKYNPSSMDLCEFCYSRLKPTGELPLSSDDDLMSLLGSEDEEEEVPDWLRSLGPEEQSKPFTEDIETDESDFGLDSLREEPEFGQTAEGADESPFAESPFEAESQEGTEMEGADWEARSFLSDQDLPEEAEATEPETFDETLEWLSSLDEDSPESGEPAVTPPPAETKPEEVSPEWFNLEEEPQPAEGEQEWDQQTVEPEAAPTEQPLEEMDWYSSLEAEFGAADFEEASPELDFQAETGEESEDEQPDWLARLGPEGIEDVRDEASKPVEPPPSEAELEFSIEDLVEKPESEDWFTSLEDEPDEELISEESQIEPEEQPEWLERLGGQELPPEAVDMADFAAPAESEPTPKAFIDGYVEADEGEAEEIPDWFSQLDELAETSSEEETEQEASEAAFVSPFTEDVDEFIEGAEAEDWFASTEEPAVQPEAQPQTPEEDLPDWLREAGEGVSAFGAFEEPKPKPPDREEIADLAEAADEAAPDWLAEAAELAEEEEPELGEPTGETSFMSFESEEEAVPDWLAKLDRDTAETPEAGSVPAFFSDEEFPPPGEEEPETYEREEEITPSRLGAAPGWLDQLSESQDRPGLEIEAVEPETLAEDEDLEPAELPGWLEAMRPSEEAASGIPFRDTSDDRTESRGVLAGVPGIISAEYDLEQVGKPPTYSSKMQVPQDQQERIDMLKALLVEEEKTAPVSKPAVLSSTFILRMIILGAFILGAIFAFWAGTERTPLPDTNAIPQHVMDLNRAVEGLPDNAPVLVAFDYETGSIPELEAAAIGTVDQLLVKGSIVRTVSTKKIGPALAKLMLDKALAMTGRLDIAQPEIAHLGYIPGGASGLQAFGRDPARLLRYDLHTTESEEMDAWKPPIFSPDEGLKNFKLVLVLTDSGESARGWIEQVGPILAEHQVPLVMIVSAQIEPMVLPYYFTVPRQVAGLATGLMGGVYLEKLSGHAGPAAKLTDAYSLTLAVAVVLMLVGSLVYLIAGQRKIVRDLRNEVKA